MHNFHLLCLNEWRTKKNSCPLCRTKIDIPINKHTLLRTISKGGVLVLNSATGISRDLRTVNLNNYNIIRDKNGSYIYQLPLAFPPLRRVRLTQLERANNNNFIYNPRNLDYVNINTEHGNYLKKKKAVMRELLSANILNL